jgi:hypothetical protein
LNLGCGDEWRAGWVNIDLRPEVSDVVCSVDQLPFADGCVAEILAEDILEHVWIDRIGAILAEWRRVLQPGGNVAIKVPNLEELARQILANAVDPDPYVRNLYGGHRWGPDGSWDSHHWGWTPASFERDLRSHGYKVLSNDRELNMTVRVAPDPEG